MQPQQSFDQFVQLLLNPSFEVTIFSSLLKIMFLIGFSIYVLFALIVVRQVFMMTSTIGTPLAPILKLFALGYLVLSIAVFLIVLMV